MKCQTIEIFTDGSCHTNFNIGAWVAILLIENEKIILKGEAQHTTHNRMELTAVIKAVEFAFENFKDASLSIYTDSQYVSHLPERKDKLKQNNYNTKKGTPLQNVDLVRILLDQIEDRPINFIKVKAHQKLEAGCSTHSVTYNIEVDKLARQMVRLAVKKRLL